MDVQKLIKEVLDKLNVDSAVLAKFQKDPMGTVKSILNTLNLDEKTLKAIVEGVTAKLNIEGGVKEATGLLGKIKSLFGK